MRGRLFLRLVLAVLASIFIYTLPAQAQFAFPTVFPKPVLLLDQDRLFAETDLGKALAAEILAKREALIKENRAIELAFETEERRLTDQRPSMDPEAFRALADEFDTRVQAAREAQLNKDLALQSESDRNRRRFFELSAPFLSRLLQKYSAGAILDRRSVLLFDKNMDITDEAIALLNEAFAQNPDLLSKEQTQ